jgi:hypothetical protein
MFLGSVVLTNTLLWMKDVQVARSADFYHEYEAGINEKIISAGKYLGRDDLGPGAIAVTPSYINLGKKRQSQFALRVTHMLTDKPIVNLPKEKQVSPEVPRLAWWLQNYGIRWYLHQHAISPWRVVAFTACPRACRNGCRAPRCRTSRPATRCTASCRACQRSRA